MRRYLPTLLIILVLLVLGGIAIYGTYNQEVPPPAPYVPSLSADPQAGSVQALLLIGAIAGTILVTIGMGVGLAVAFNFMARHAAPIPTQEDTPSAPARPGPKTAGEAPQIFLSDSRSVAIFGVGLVVLIVGFLYANARNRPLGYVPNLFVTATPTPVPLPTQAPAAGGADAATLQAEFAALPKGDGVVGKAVFASAGCAACHSLEPEVKIVGPSQAGVATRAATRRPGYSAELYLYESITNPNAYIVEGFSSPSPMPADFKSKLTPQQLADVIAFLLTLK